MREITLGNFIEYRSVYVRLLPVLFTWAHRERNMTAALCERYRLTLCFDPLKQTAPRTWGPREMHSSLFAW